MIKKITYSLIDIGILIFSVFIIILFYLGNIYNLTLLGIYLLLINIYICFKFRGNKVIFLSFLILFYFNYSFVISKYIGEPSNMLLSSYLKLTDSNVLVKGILSIIFLFSMLNITINPRKCIDSTKYLINMNIKNIKMVTIIFQLLLILILIYCFIVGVTSISMVIMEYSIFFFIFAFIISKNNKWNKRITELIMFGYIIFYILAGGRIAALQFLIVDFLINYIDKFNKKQIISIMLIGIIIFTYFGIYGDILVTSGNYGELTLKKALEDTITYKFSLSTSVSSYFTTLATINATKYFTVQERIKDGISYFIYSFSGIDNFYPNLDFKIRKYFPNGGGGLPTGYFYYYFGFLGIIFISIYISFILKKIFTSNSYFIKFFRIYIISTIPRWYLYEPTSIIRGAFLFCIFYFIMNFILKMSKNTQVE